MGLPILSSISCMLVSNYSSSSDVFIVGENVPSVINISSVSNGAGEAPQRNLISYFGNIFQNVMGLPVEQ